MLKVMYVLLAVALAGTASAAGWRKLQIDASSEGAFKQSVATFQRKLSPSRRAAFAASLRDIEQEGKTRARAEQRDYTRAEYLEQLHGLGYEEIVTLVDPTGKRAGLYRAAYYQSRPFANHPNPPPDRYRLSETGTFNRSFQNENVLHGGTDLVGVPGQK
jgi:hypothetical protein